MKNFNHEISGSLILFITMIRVALLMLLSSLIVESVYGLFLTVVEKISEK